MARGGKRAPTPGSQYANRKDLQQAPTAAPGQQYGKAQAQVEAQKAVPLPSTPGPAAAAQLRQIPVPPTAAAPMPGAMPFDRPTERPGEPVTAGLPSGAGPGPEALNLAPPDTVGAQLHALYQMHPNDDLLRLLNLRSQGF